MQVLEELLCDDGDEQTHEANVDENSPETKDGAVEESSNDQGSVVELVIKLII